jgi:hypothetical protein
VFAFAAIICPFESLQLPLLMVTQTTKKRKANGRTLLRVLGGMQFLE